MKSNRRIAVAVVLAVGSLACDMGYAHGDLHDRINSLTRQIAASPNEARLYLQRAELQSHHGDWLRVLADCAHVQKLDPTLEIDLLCGRTCLESGRPQDALPPLNRFIERHPDHPQALACRARAQVRLGKPAAAAADYRRALAHNPNPEPDLVQQAANLLDTHGAAQEALQVLDAALAKLGAVPSLALQAIDLEITTKNFPAAFERIEGMRHASPRPEPWMAKRASVLALAGRRPESRLAWLDLMDHLRALPPAERGSHAMSQLLEQAQQALASLDSLSATTHPPPNP